MCGSQKKKSGFFHATTTTQQLSFFTFQLANPPHADAQAPEHASTPRAANAGPREEEAKQAAAHAPVDGPVVDRLFAAIASLQTHLDARLDSMEAKIDAVTSRLAQLETHT